MGSLGGYLKDLENKAVYIINEAFASFKKPATLWSTGKDSTLLLYLITKVAGHPEIPVIHLDTGFKFPEIYEFRDKIAREWNLNLVISRNDDLDITPFKVDRFTCCHHRKTLNLRKVIEENGFDAIFVAIRWDEHGIRGKERHFSPRDENMLWDYRNQPIEIGDLYQTEYPSAHHVRVHPIIDWPLEAVWRYTLVKDLPVNPLYFKGYSSLGCWPCTKPTIPEEQWYPIYQLYLEGRKREALEKLIPMVVNVTERSGRAQDKEKELMQKLRFLGYM